MVVEQAQKWKLVQVNKEETIKASEDSEVSQNPWGQQDQKGTWTPKVMDIERCDQCHKKISEFREHSANLQIEAEAVIASEDICTLNKCKDKYSESSRNLSSSVGSNVSVPKFSWFKSMSQIVGLTAAWQQNKVEGNPIGANTASNAKTSLKPVHTEFNFFL